LQHSQAGFYEDAFSDEMLGLLRAFAAHNKWLASIDVGSLALGKAGLLPGRRATTYPGADGRRCEQLRLAGANYVDAPIVADGLFITGSGSGAALSVSLALLERVTNTRTAAKVRSLMAVPDSAVLSVPAAGAGAPAAAVAAAGSAAGSGVPPSPSPAPPAGSPMSPVGAVPLHKMPTVPRPQLGPAGPVSPRSAAPPRGPSSVPAPIATAPPASFAANDYGSSSQALVEAQRRNESAIGNATTATLATVNIGGQVVTGSKGEVEEAALRKILEAQEATSKNREVAEKQREAMAKIQAAQSEIDKHKQRASALERTMSVKGGVRAKAGGPKCEFCGENPPVAKVVFDSVDRKPLKCCKDCTALLHRDPNAPRPGSVTPRDALALSAPTLVSATNEIVQHATPLSPGRAGAPVPISGGEQRDLQSRSQMFTPFAGVPPPPPGAPAYATMGAAALGAAMPPPPAGAPAYATMSAMPPNSRMASNAPPPPPPGMYNGIPPPPARVSPAPPQQQQQQQPQQFMMPPAPPGGAPPVLGGLTLPPPPPSDSQPEQQQQQQQTYASDPRYQRFLKMKSLGAPVQQLRPQMLAEGLNPAALETPNAVVEDPPPQASATDALVSPRMRRPSNVSSQPPPEEVAPINPADLLSGLKKSTSAKNVSAAVQAPAPGIEVKLNKTGTDLSALDKKTLPKPSDASPAPGVQLRKTGKELAPALAPSRSASKLQTRGPGAPVGRAGPGTPTPGSPMLRGRSSNDGLSRNSGRLATSQENANSDEAGGPLTLPGLADMANFRAQEAADEQYMELPPELAELAESRESRESPSPAVSPRNANDSPARSDSPPLPTAFVTLKRGGQDALPVGWNQAMTPEGAIYFWHVDGRSVWERPKE
jgi:hypothetical protein